MPQPITSVRSSAVVLSKDDVDTDQIIPARFLTTTDRTGLGRYLFADWRDAGSTTFSAASGDAGASQILVAGRNFGCGSSREHAVWALADFGFRAVIARSFADIFRANALRNSLVPVALADDDHAELVSHLTREASLDVSIDLLAMTVNAGGNSWTFDLAPFARRCLLDGVDELGFLLAADEETTRWELSHETPYAGVALLGDLGT